MKMLIITLLVFNAINASAQFKNIKWGMTKDQIIKLDSIKNAVDSGDFLTVIKDDGYFYTEKVYEFEENSLISVSTLDERTDKKANTVKYATEEFSARYSVYVGNEYGQPYKVAFGGPTYALWKTKSHKLLMEIAYDEKHGFALRTQYFEPTLLVNGLE